ncbi:MAG: nucleotidyltransferase domain-containing protein [Firmicutes bacterium]|nr:nucleotidyltransferase domain-containing protein [Bacillota bacterium]
MINLTQEEKKQITEIITSIVPLHEVWVFGSRTGEDIRSYSDIDIVIRGSEVLPLLVSGELKNAFQESDLPFRVDVLDWNTITDEFREIISSNYEILLPAPDRTE